MNPIEINGNWVMGYTLDVHTVNSIFIGIDEMGHERFDTERSELGELMYKLKYRADKEACDKIMEIISLRTKAWMDKNDITGIIAMPPTNKNRVYQPVDYLAQELSDTTGVIYYKDYLEKKSSVEMKNTTSTFDLGINRIGKLERKRNVLLIDDLYKTGRSMKAACSAIQSDCNVCNIFTLAITRTRR